MQPESRRPAIRLNHTPFLQQDELLAYCNNRKIAFTAYSPLGSGDRPDAMKSDREPELFKNETIRDIAAKHDLSAAQVMLAWAINRGTIPIPKSINPERQLQNLTAASVELPVEDMRALAAIDQHYRFVDGTFWEVPGGPYSVAALWDEIVDR